MDYARDRQNGKLVAAEDASPVASYVCPHPGCGGGVFLRDGGSRRAHFAHYSGEGTEACDEYFPSLGSGGESFIRPASDVEADPSSLGLLLAEVDGRWGLGLRLPEIPSEELGETSLSALRSAHVEVFVGRERHARVSALELRPGVGSARVDVAPSLQSFRTQPTGSWPSLIDKATWALEARGVEAKGDLFRLRRGEWVRLLAGAAVHQGETLLALADTRFAPPVSIVSATHAQFSSGGLQWTIWEVDLPRDEGVASVRGWLEQLGHDLVPRQWSVELVTPPRAFDERGEPVFWIGDSPVVALEAPRADAATTVAFQSGSNSHTVAVQAPPSGRAHVTVGARQEGRTRVLLAGDRSAGLDLVFIARPPATSLGDALSRTARLRIEVGQQSFEAWRGGVHRLRVAPREHVDVHVDFGDESVRARVTAWERGKQRSIRGLDPRGVERTLQDAIPNCERLEIDAGNVGLVALAPVHVSAQATREEAVNDRLAWRDRVLSLSEDAAATLVRSRLTLRRRMEARGPR